MNKKSATPKDSIYKYLMFPEMRIFWMYFLLSAAISIVSFLYTPQPWGLLIIGVLLLLVATAFIDKSRVIKSSIIKDEDSARFQAVIENDPNGIIIYDINFKILIWNPMAEKIFGLTRQESIGQIFGPDKVGVKRYRTLVQTLFPSLAPSAIKKTEVDADPQIMDISFKEPSLDIRVTTAPIYLGGAKTGFLKIVTDRAKETAVYRLKSEFISTAAHQLRTPLTQINWALGTLAKDPTISEEGKKIAIEGFAISQETSKVADDLLSAAEMEEGKFGYKFEALDLTALISGLVENTRRYIKQLGINIAVNFEDVSDRVILSGDSSRLSVAISNILDNAVRYNQENGSINISLKPITSKPYVEISITDTGIGISQGDVAQISQKFFRAENAKRAQASGSGLGLYIVKNIIHRHGGSFNIESTLGRGTTVRFTLPTDPNLIPTTEMIYED